jgi:hypothetical protein
MFRLFEIFSLLLAQSREHPSFSSNCQLFYSPFKETQPLALTHPLLTLLEEVSVRSPLPASSRGQINRHSFLVVYP